jgi:sn-glycerol 3-phosphate transport system permease protein
MNGKPSIEVTRRHSWPLQLAMLLLTGLMLFPLFWMLRSSLTPTEQIFGGGLAPLPFPPTLEQYSYALTRVPLPRYLLNSLLVAAPVTALQLGTSMLAAYAFARFQFWGRELLFWLVLGALLVPDSVTMIPNYLLVAELGWLNSFPGLIAPQAVSALGIFLLRQQMRALPEALFDAARLDGANSWQTLWLVVAPLLAPSLAALAITFFLQAWNEYLWPRLVATDDEMLLIQVAIQRFNSAEAGAQWGPLMAAATVACLPPLLVYLLLQRRIMATFINTGLKG